MYNGLISYAQTEQCAGQRERQGLGLRYGLLALRCVCTTTQIQQSGSTET